MASRTDPALTHRVLRDFLTPEVILGLVEGTRRVAIHLAPVVERAIVRMRPVLEGLEVYAEKALPVLHQVTHVAAEVKRQVEAAPPSSGYEPWLRERDHSLVAARVLAHHVKRCGIARAEAHRVEHQQIPAALRRLARPGTRDRTVARVANEMRALPNAERHILAVFARIGRPDVGEEFVACLAQTTAAVPTACRALATLAQSVEGQVPTRRARPLTAASAAHEFALSLAWKSDEQVLYSYSDYTRRFQDPLTHATQREFGITAFDPRPAVRRLRAGKIMD